MFSNIPYLVYSTDHNAHKKAQRPRLSLSMGWRIGRKRPNPAAAADSVLADWKQATTRAEKKKRATTGWEKPTSSSRTGNGGRGLAGVRGAGGGSGVGVGGYTVAHVPSQKTIDEDAEVSV